MQEARSDAALPGVVGVGTDLVDVERLRGALSRQQALRERLFCEGEWGYAERHRDPVPHLAARFAAKEAVMKALGHGMEHIAFTDIEILRDERGQPWVHLRGRAAALAEQQGVTGWRLSLSHTDALAQAVAIAVSGPPS